MIRTFFQKIPKLPLSALIFYLLTLSFWKLKFIPNPLNILLFLQNLYEDYGLVGLFIASFLEGVVYFGLYFPGSFIVALAVILSNGSFKSLIFISLIVAFALTLTSIINYNLGKKILSNRLNQKLIIEEKKIISKGLIASMLHPNLLAFYFFNSGIKQQNFLKILLVPLVMIPYGLVLGYLFYSVKEPLKVAIENPYVMITLILIWLFVAFIFRERSKL